MELNIIGDIGGQYDSLIRLVKKMPEATVLSLGDMVDRGPKSKEVVDWFMKNGMALRGNHEDMFLDYLQGHPKYGSEVYLWNGGGATLESYDNLVPFEHRRWLEGLPLYYKQHGLIVTHAPIAKEHTLEECLVDDNQFECGNHVTWCRKNPGKITDSFQVFGHNSFWGFAWFAGNLSMPKFSSKAPAEAWAVCLDNSRAKVLTGMHWPSLEIFQEPF